LYPNNAGHDEDIKRKISISGTGLSHGKGRKNPWKGKTYEQRYGIEEAFIKRRQHSKVMKDKPSLFKGKTLAERFGQEKALEVGRKISASKTGRTYEDLYGDKAEEKRELKREQARLFGFSNKGSTKYTSKVVAKLANAWKDPNSKFQAPDYWGRVMKSKGAKPNKLEVYFRDVLTKYFGDSWQFVGDMTFRLYDDNMNFRNPDFKHKTLKKLIEIFNVYDKVKHYGSLKVYKQVTTRHYSKCGYEVKYFTDKEVYRHTDIVLAEVAIYEGIGVLC
jgi:hypothetical protein